MTLAAVLTYTLIAEVFAEQLRRAPTSTRCSGRARSSPASCGRWAWSASSRPRWSGAGGFGFGALLAAAAAARAAAGRRPAPGQPGRGALFVASLALGVTVGLALEFLFGGADGGAGAERWAARAGPQRGGGAPLGRAAAAGAAALGAGRGRSPGCRSPSMASAPLQIYTGTGEPFALLALQAGWAVAPVAAGAAGCGGRAASGWCRLWRLNRRDGRLRRLLRLWGVYADLDLLFLTRGPEAASCWYFVSDWSSASPRSRRRCCWRSASTASAPGRSDAGAVHARLRRSWSAACWTCSSATTSLYISRRIGRGQLDHTLIQPQPLWLALLTEGFVPVLRLGRCCCSALGLLVWAAAQLALPLTPGWLALLVLNLAASAAIVLAFSLPVGQPGVLGAARGRGDQQLVRSADEPAQAVPARRPAARCRWRAADRVPVGLVAWYPSRALLGSTRSPWRRGRHAAGRARSARAGGLGILRTGIARTMDAPDRSATSPSDTVVELTRRLQDLPPAAALGAAGATSARNLFRPPVTRGRGAAASRPADRPRRDRRLRRPERRRQEHDRQAALRPAGARRAARCARWAWTRCATASATSAGSASSSASAPSCGGTTRSRPASSGSGWSGTSRAQRYERMLGLVRELLGLDEFFNSLARELSLGQRMRADLGLALLHEPELLFLDEPTLGPGRARQAQHPRASSRT